MSKYLILKLGALGDLSFFLPVVDQLKKHDSKAQVTWIVGSAYAEFLRKHPQIDRVISVDEKMLFHGSFFQRLKAVMSLWVQLEFFYNGILMGHRTLGAFLFVRLRVLGRVFQVVRKPSHFWSWMRTEVVIPPLRVQESLAFKLLAESVLGQSIPIESWNWRSDWIPSPSFLTPALNSGVQSPLIPTSPSLDQKNAHYVCLHIGGGSNAKTEFLLKKWPYWQEFLECFLKETDFRMILVGAPSERSEAEALVRSLDSGQGRIENQVGQTQIIELVALLKSASGFVGVDSGPLHFADSMGVPCVGIYGPTSSVSWGLIGPHSRVLQKHVACSPCYLDDGVFPECRFSHVCMKTVRASELLTVLQEVLSQR